MCSTSEATLGEVEITPEMLRAGLDGLREYIPDYDWPEDAVQDIFRAMMRAQREAL